MTKFVASEFLLKSNYTGFSFTSHQEPSDIFIDFSPFIVEDDERKTIDNVCRFVANAMSFKNRRIQICIWACISSVVVNHDKEEISFDEIIELACSAYDFLKTEKSKLGFVFGEADGANMNLTLVNMDEISRQFAKHLQV
jgi:hypothetical protein